MTLTILAERHGDAPAIEALTREAFHGMEFSSGTEAAIVAALRRSGELALSLVALDGQSSLVGHAAFSPVTIEGQRGEVFGLGPISVHPAHQRRGIGSALVETGLERMRAIGATAIVLVGDPQYYARFGFRSGGLTYAGVPDHYVQWHAFGPLRPSGRLDFSPAFSES